MNGKRPIPPRDPSEDCRRGWTLPGILGCSRRRAGWTRHGGCGAGIIARSPIVASPPAVGVPVEEVMAGADQRATPPDLFQPRGRNCRGLSCSIRPYMGGAVSMRSALRPRTCLVCNVGRIRSLIESFCDASPERARLVVAAGLFRRDDGIGAHSLQIGNVASGDALFRHCKLTCHQRSRLTCRGLGGFAVGGSDAWSDGLTAPSNYPFRCYTRVQEFGSMPKREFRRPF